MRDSHTRIADLKAQVAAFVRERDWEQFHSPKNLSMSIAIEAAELMEHFQWLTLEESRAVGSEPTKMDRIREEVADIVLYLLNFCTQLSIDLSACVTDKIEKNADKYPIELVKGRADVSRA